MDLRKLSVALLGPIALCCLPVVFLEQFGNPSWVLLLQGLVAFIFKFSFALFVAPVQLTNKRIRLVRFGLFYVGLTAISLACANLLPDLTMIWLLMNAVMVFHGVHALIWVGRWDHLFLVLPIRFYLALTLGNSIGFMAWFHGFKWMLPHLNVEGSSALVLGVTICLPLWMYAALLFFLVWQKRQVRYFWTALNHPETEGVPMRIRKEP